VVIADGNEVEDFEANCDIATEVTGVTEDVNVQLPALLLQAPSKFFYKTRDYIQFFFYYHVAFDCIEVIGYNGASDCELNRVYVSYNNLVACSAASLAEVVQLKKFEETSMNRYNGDEVFEKVLSDENRDSVLCSYLLNRLQLFQDGRVYNLKYERFTLDLADYYPLLSDIPLGLVQMPAKGKRSYTTEEITKTLYMLSSEHASLKDATGDAMRKSRLLGFALSAFSSKRCVAGSTTKWGKMWQRACHKVVQLMQVERTKQVLRSLNSNVIY
jgi:hypothetical protein